MGEIRSTLDIIMEKAERVEVTEEDKAVFMKREVEGKLRGLLQKYLDGIMNPDQFKREIEAMSGERRAVARAILKKECLDRVEPGEDNRSLLDILVQVVDLDVKPVQELLSKYEQEQGEKRCHYETALRKNLEDKGISGSAVVPNLAAGPEWHRFLSEVKERFHQKTGSQ